MDLELVHGEPARHLLREPYEGEAVAGAVLEEIIQGSLGRSPASVPERLVVDQDEVLRRAPFPVVDLERSARIVPPRAAGVDPEEAPGALQVQVVSAQVNRHPGAPQIEGFLFPKSRGPGRGARPFLQIFGDPTVVEDQRQDRMRVLRGIDPPPGVVPPDVAGIPHPAGLFPTGQEKDVFVPASAVVVVDLPALPAGIEGVDALRRRPRLGVRLVDPV